jgi:hypothetical protein
VALGRPDDDGGDLTRLAAMSEPTTGAREAASNPNLAAEHPADDVQAELDRRGAEILRLRDLLIVKDAELGAALGQLAQLESMTRTLMVAAGRVQRRVPWAMRIATAILRRLRGRAGRSSG